VHLNKIYGRYSHIQVNDKRFDYIIVYHPMPRWPSVPFVFDNQTTKTSSKHRPLNLLPESSRKAKKIKHPRKIYHLTPPPRPYRPTPLPPPFKNIPSLAGPTPSNPNLAYSSLALPSAIKLTYPVSGTFSSIHPLSSVMIIFPSPRP